MEFKGLLTNQDQFTTKDNTTIYAYTFLINGELLKLYSQNPISIPTNDSEDLSLDPLPVTIKTEIKIKDGKLKAKLISVN